MTARAAEPARDTKKEKEVTVALVGRPNAGKSSLYNAVTGGDAKVGNFPGITVDVLESHAALPNGGRARFLDLPGVYSLGDDVDPDSDEGQARACLDGLEKRGEPYLVAQVIDATQLALALRLTKDILEHGIPVVIFVTQRDVLEREGGTLDASVLESALGVPVVAVSARDANVRARVLEAIANAKVTAPEPRNFEPRDLATRAITRKRKETEHTARADAILLHPILGPIIFVAIMTALFSAVFLVADPASTALDALLGRLSKAITSAFGEHWWTSLVCDGILGGAGTVLAFLPQIVDPHDRDRGARRSGLPRARRVPRRSRPSPRRASADDRSCRCSPRTRAPSPRSPRRASSAIRSERLTHDPRSSADDVLGAHPDVRAPHRSVLRVIAARSTKRRSSYACISQAFWPGSSRRSCRRDGEKRRPGRSLPLVLEMPSYRLPQARVVARKAWRSCTRFVREVGTMIVAASVVLWGLLVPAQASTTRGRRQRSSSPSSRSRARAHHASARLRLAHQRRPHRKLRRARAHGVDARRHLRNRRDRKKRRAARRSPATNDPAYTTATALSLMAFFVLACQCMSTVAALKRETKGWKVPLFVLAYTYAAAYVASLVTYQIAHALA